jgi:magnesium-protoporphyrin O-methyltransferase
LRLRLDALVTTRARDLVLDVHRVIERDRLRRRRREVVRATGHEQREGRDAERREPRSRPLVSSRSAPLCEPETMSKDLPTRLRALYTGETDEVWTRIEREAPATYWEENAVLGRADTYRELLNRLQPIAGRRILDAGCGRGLMARRLAAQGASVTAVDVLADHVSEARERGMDRGPTVAVADFRDLIAARGAFDDIIIQEVLEDYTAEETLDLVRALALGDARRVHIVFRQPRPWGGLLAGLLPAALVPTLDPVTLLRSFHRHTPYRLSRQESVRRRSYDVKIVELTLQEGL